jgi:hypothetical protein
MLKDTHCACVKVVQQGDVARLINVSAGLCAQASSALKGVNCSDELKIAVVILECCKHSIVVLHAYHVLLCESYT